MSSSINDEEIELSQLTDKNQTQLIISKLVKLCTTANDKYPSGTDYRYFCSYPSFNEQSNNLSKNVLTLLNTLCNFANPNDNKIDLLSENNEYLRWQTISDSADHCIEEVDFCLDQVKEENNNQSLHTKNNCNSSSSLSQKQNQLFSGDIDINAYNYNSLELLYPQRAFLDIIDNKRIINTMNATDNKHPYEHEINNICYKKEQLLYRKEAIEIHAIEDTLFYWIDSEESLSTICNVLKNCNEIAVDLEHHNKYTFYGLTCLIQISAERRDYIIDALVLRKCIHSYLNPIFTNSNIVKVFHGSTNDILWLQRDFSIYVVNLFDTFEAAKLLNLKEKSLKYLLNTYCDIDTNKDLRKTDWRIRPLRPELIDYARKDTHYSLYIYHHLTNELIAKSRQNMDLLRECYANSAKQSLIRYNKPYFDANGWQDLCKYNGWYFTNNKSLEVLAKLYEWRDRIGRQLDQSVEVVLSNKLLKKIVTGLRLPVDIKKYHLSVIAKKYYKDILDIINECVEDELDDNNNDHNNNNNKKNVNDLNEICLSNDGCFSNISDEMVATEMMAPKVNDCEKNKSFFPILNRVKEAHNNAQNIVDDVFNQISNEPIFGEKEKGEKKKSKRNRNENKKQKLKNNNVYSAKPRNNPSNKIFGSRYVNTKAKKQNVFKLPRNNNNNQKKRKSQDVDFYGPILENIQPAKRQKVSKRHLQRRRIMQETNAVEKEWPINKTNQNEIKNQNPNTKMITNNKQNNNEKAKAKNNKFEEDIDDIEITESDMLDAAPVPVLDTKFNVYDPFKST